MKRSLISFFLFATMAAPGALAEPGRTTAQFLTRDTGTRALALGGAFAAVWDDVESLSYNPAGIGTLSQTQINAMYSQGLASDGFSFIGAATPLFKPCYFGLGITHYDGGSIELNLSDGVRGNKKAEDDWTGAAALAYRPFDFISIGGSLKSFHSALAEDFKMSGTAADGGVTVEIPDSLVKVGRLYAAASVINLGSDVTYHQVKDPLPAKTSGALAWKYERIKQDGAGKEPAGWQMMALTDLSKTKNDDALMAFGFEVTQINLFNSDASASLRAGYKALKNAPTTRAGFSWGYPSWNLNYAVVIHKAGFYHQFALAFKL